jgi:hypothetical protein
MREGERRIVREDERVGEGGERKDGREERG